MIKGRIIEKGSPRMKKRDLNNITKAALSSAAVLWFNEFLPGHFEESAARKYHYAGRSRKYKKAKKRKMGHTIDLVFSGRLKRQIVQSYRIRATHKRARMSLYGPPYLNMYVTLPGRRRSPDKRAEIVKTIRAEEKKLTKAIDTHMTRALNSAGPQTITTRI